MMMNMMNMGLTKNDQLGCNVRLWSVAKCISSEFMGQSVDICIEMRI